MKFVVYLMTFPLMAQLGVNLYSVEKERALEEQYASEIRRQSEPISDPSIQTYVDRVGGDLSSGFNNPRLAYRFHVISGGNRTEPFALPGGYVFIPAPIFINTRDENEFAGALAHAIAHAVLRHGTSEASRGQISNGSSIPVVYMGSWTCSHADSNNSLLAPVRFLEVQRTYELEADQLGLELAARSGYDASALLRYVERTHPKDTSVSALPKRDLRIARIQQRAATLPVTKRSLSGEFKSVQERIRLVTERAPPNRVPRLRR